MTDTGELASGSPTAAPVGTAQDQFTVSPFARLARTHAISTAGDAMVATTLAGTVFFQGATSQARGKVFLYLLLTMAPFALVAPLIGPALDRARSGRRWMIFGACLLRAVLMLFMMRDVESLWFYPEAFTVLVLQKGYAIARSALVPTTITSDAELVEANSKLSLISGIMSFLGAAPAALLFKLGGPSWSLGLASFTFLVATALSVRIHSRPVAAVRADATEKAELRGGGVLLAASAMGLIRGIVGFLTLLLAFDFRRHGVPKWHFALVAGVSVGGSLLGAVVAPRLRKLTTEERMIIGVLVVLVLAGFTSFGLGGVTGGAILGLAVGVGAVTAKLAFDSIVQRDAPDANRGRSFAKFETRFQMIWVIGALIGLIDMPARVGFLIIMLVAAFAAFSYGVGSLAWKHRTGTLTPATERAVEIEDRINEGKAAAAREFLRGVRASRVRASAALRARRGEGQPEAVPGAVDASPALPATVASGDLHSWPDEPPSVDPLLDAPPSFGPKVFDQEKAPITPRPAASAPTEPTTSIVEPVTEPLPEGEDEPVGWGRPEQSVDEDTLAGAIERASELG